MPGTIRSLSGCMPDPVQPLWRRVTFIALATASLAFIVPAPVVVSDISHTVIGFEALPGRTNTTAGQAPAVWIVQQTDVSELYSNGLRIETEYAVHNQQRFFQVYDRRAGLSPGDVWYSEPVGIVFHATESPLLPFAADQNENLQKVGRSLLRHVQANRSYNFVVDRFGRVFRIVNEVDVAYHAGNSVWAAGPSVFLNLNNSFVGVAFESAGEATLNPAQTAAARMLTQYLRNRFRIPVENCVTHAQVSVNPSNHRIGYHTDAGKGFPFVELGLTDNYQLPVAAVADFGFTYDDAFQQAIGTPWHGLVLAEERLRAEAKQARRTLEEHRQRLRAQYRRLYESLVDRS